MRRHRVREDACQGMSVGWIEAYVYNADLYCEDCGEAIKRELRAEGHRKSDDSEEWPQGPYEDGGGEADSPWHCGSNETCVNAMEFDGTKVGVWLGNPLTSDGVEGLTEMLSETNSEYQRQLHEFWMCVYSDYLEGWEPPPGRYGPGYVPPEQMPLPGVRARRHVARQPESVDDPFYIIQGLYNGPEAYSAFAEFGFDDEETAIREAEKLLRLPYFEGDYVRVITRDGELVWDSRSGAQERRRTSRRHSTARR